MNKLPSTQNILGLFYLNQLEEAKICALHGLSLLNQMYSGRGGQLTTKTLVPEMIKKMVAYLDILYRISLKNNDISSAFLYMKHLRYTNIYSNAEFDNLATHVNTSIESITNKVYKVYISCLWLQQIKLSEKNWKHLFDGITIDNKLYLGCKSHKTTYILTENKEEADYFVILWGSNVNLTQEQLKRTIFFRTEPLFPDKVQNNHTLIKGDGINFLRFYDYCDVRYPNCSEYWLPCKELEFQCYPIIKEGNLLSAIVSQKYVDPGHILRIDLLKYIIQEYQNLAKILHIYGFNNAHNFPENNYKGALPDYDKSNGLLKYKYTIASENNSIKGYSTEKIIDGILSECVVFYWGCPNIEDFFPKVNGILPYIILPMENKEESVKVIIESIKGDKWSEMIYAIKETKKLILSKFTLQKRILQVLEDEIHLKTLGEDAMNLLRLARIEKDKKISYNTILYRGERFDELSYMLKNSNSVTKENQVVLKKYEGMCDMTLPENTIFIQEFSNTIHDQNISYYDIGHVRFSVRNFVYVNPPKIYCINLKRRPDRLETFLKRFPKTIGFECEIFDAVDGIEMERAGFSEGIKYLFRGNDFCSKNTVIGCALSHIKLWKQLVADKQHDYYLILEDDVEFVDSYCWKLFTMMQMITFSYDLIFLHHHVCYEETEGQRIESNELPKWESMERYIVPKRSSWVGTASYILSRAGAHYLLNEVDEHGVNHGIDYWLQLRFTKMKCYGANPLLNIVHYDSPLCPYQKIDSDIQI